MRPLPGDNAWIGRQRSADHDSASFMTSASSSQMSFVLAEESAIDSYIEQGNPHSRFLDIRKATSSAAFLPPRREDKDFEASRQAVAQSERDSAYAYSPTSRGSIFTHSPASMISHNPSSPSRPITPMMLDPSLNGSVISTPSSRRNSLTESLSENAVSSDDEPLEQTPSLNNGGAPQLVMPSIKMPSRRPFTETGKSLGRLKVLLAGDSGIGKTSMVKSIVQICEHIVHVDPIPSQTEPVRQRQVAMPRGPSSSTPNISEIYASTKPYPEWWSMLNEPDISQRRKSLGDSVLERNVCFVDTPGYRNGSSAMETIMPCVEYVESHLNKMSSDSMSDSDMLNMLGGDGGFQVDVVFYLISQKMKPVDLEYIRRLAPLTNVIPIIAHADSLSPTQLTTCKEQVLGQLQQAGVKAFSFASGNRQDDMTSVPSIPYAVSSASGSDHDVMDASLLMSSEYVQPLMTSELKYLVENVFSSNGISWLRHTAAKKYLEWRTTTPSRPRHLYEPLSAPGPTPSSALTRWTGRAVPCSSQALARLNDQHRDQNPPQLHVVDWAADLQRSLASERIRSEALARGERALWHAEKLNEIVQDGTLVTLNKTKGAGSVEVRKVSRRKASTKTSQHQDPLGLLQVVADLKAKGWVALEVVGGIGVIGGLAFWLSRLHWHMEPVQLADEWARQWGMDI
ncbi:hypothetical protein M426DRAFT_320233 [Hypoxylon sp. CI-4A]|nr:hypothetical protein M426DRAFT_320233 [Hypoxylon sp. CI-4A]